MAENKDLPGLDSKQEQMIFSLLREKNKRDAARKAGIPESTMYRWLADPQFIAAYRAARRGLFDDALAVLEKNAARAAQALADELDGADSMVVITAATRLLDRAFKAQEAIADKEELANSRAALAALKAIKTPLPAVNPEKVSMATEQDMAEAVEAARLRIAWMDAIGHGAEDIEASLRYNRPQSVVEERHLLELVRAMLEQERTYSGASP